MEILCKILTLTGNTGKHDKSKSCFDFREKALEKFNTISFREENYYYLHHTVLFLTERSFLRRFSTVAFISFLVTLHNREYVHAIFIQRFMQEAKKAEIPFLFTLAWDEV